MPYFDQANILVVDDTPHSLRLLVEILTEQGYKVRPASSGELALNFVRTTPPDLILLDIMMPHMDGYELCQRLKADEQTQNIPIIFISAMGELFDKVKAFNMGGVDYITKPFQVEEVLVRVKTHLKLRHTQYQLEERNEQLKQEIIERQEAEAKAKKMTDRWAALLNLVGEGITLSDEQGYFEIFNPKMTEITGYTKEEANHSLDFLGMLYPDYSARQEVLNDIREINRVGDQKEVETTIRTKENVHKTLLVSTTRVQFNNQEWFLSAYRDITTRKQMEQALQESERFTRAIIDALPAHICVLDEHGTLVTVNQAWRNFAATNSLDVEQVAEGTNYLAVCDQATGDQAKDAFDFAAGIRAVMRGDRETYSLEYPCDAPNEQRWFVGSVTRFRGQGPLYVVVSHENITERKQAEIALQKSQALLTKAQEVAHLGSWEVVIATGESFWSDELFRICGYKPGAFEPTQDIGMQLIHPEDRTKTIEAIREAIEESGLYCIEKRIVRPDGTVRHVLSQGEVVYDSAGQPVKLVGSFLDITERKQAEEALQKANEMLHRLATLDGLTQVANRRRFDQYLHQAWEIASHMQTKLALLLCDIDYFKRYNDYYGHQAGDDCLRQVVQAISRLIHRSEDLVARYGGEEFAVIMPDTTEAQACEMAEAIQREINRLHIEHRASDVSDHITLSIGLACTTPNHTNSPEILIRHTDEALYEAKAKGRNCIIGNYDMCG